MEIFESKIDVWLAAILVLTILLCFLVSFRMASKMDVAGLLGALLIALSGVALPVWLLLATHYTITGENLKIQSGPFSWVIAINEITTIKETRNPLSSPALSLDRLQIFYKGGKSVMVSSKNKQAFLNAINQEI